ncbi:hypothetical protein [Pantoea sp. PSNIH1]|uniref:hypothetical protein n=1 Tax=Pantoea sp. PSNIH1 TaxID=1484158 RepID=UPI0011A94A87|nr:hypothetical protein [Pantoea sp. PSNIH1]
MKKEESESRAFPVKEDMVWQLREARIQNAGKYILCLIVILGACGLFSKGFLSNGHVESQDGSLEVRYERFGRMQSNMNMSIHIPARHGERFTVTIGNGAPDKLEIQTLQPQPIEAVARANDLQLTYLTRDAQAGHTIWIGMQPQAMGSIPMSISVQDGLPALFSLWIYP